MTEEKKGAQGISFYVPRGNIRMIQKRDGTSFAKVTLPKGVEAGGADWSGWKLAVPDGWVKPDTGRVWMPEANREGAPWEANLSRDFGGYVQDDAGGRAWEPDERTARIPAAALADAVRAAMHERKGAYNYVRIPAAKWVGGEKMDTMRQIPATTETGRALVAIELPSRFFIDYAAGGGVDASDFEVCVPEDTVREFPGAYSLEVPKANREGRPWTLELTRMREQEGPDGGTVLRKATIAVTSDEFAAAAERCMAERRSNAQERAAAREARSEEARRRDPSYDPEAFDDNPMRPDPDFEAVRDGAEPCAIAADIGDAARAAKAKEAPANPTHEARGL